MQQKYLCANHKKSVFRQTKAGKFITSRTALHRTHYCRVNLAPLQEQALCLRSLFWLVEIQLLLALCGLWALIIPTVFARPLFPGLGGFPLIHVQISTQPKTQRGSPGALWSSLSVYLPPLWYCTPQIPQTLISVFQLGKIIRLFRFLLLASRQWARVLIRHSLFRSLFSGITIHNPLSNVRKLFQISCLVFQLFMVKGNSRSI